MAYIDCENCYHGKVCQYRRIYHDSIVACKDWQPTADVAPKSDEGAECPTCHGTGRIGTTDWLTKGLSKKQLAEEKAKAVAEHEKHIKIEVAREIFEEIEKLLKNQEVVTENKRLKEVADWIFQNYLPRKVAELKKKYTEEMK